MKVVFFGNHDVGIMALDSLRECCTVAAVVAHPPDPEDGVRYASVHDHARACGLPVLRARGKDTAVRDLVAATAPDLLWITDYRYLLPASLLALAPLGAVNLHPSLLPRYRGRAPINWAILHGERELGLTAHVVDEGMDTGDILAQRRIMLDETEDVGDALARLLPHYRTLPSEIVAAMRAGTLVRTPQDHAAASAFPARTPADGLIDWSRPAVAVRDLVRAVAAPYPGAFSMLDGHRVTVWRARIVPGRAGAAPGTVLALDAAAPVVQCGDDALQLLRVETTVPTWTVGGRFA